MAIYFNSKNHYYLSNFFYCRVPYENIVWKSAEHAYQAMKTNDEIERRFIHGAETSSLAKKNGRKVTIRNDWDEIKDQIMYEIVKAKFENNTDLMKLLQGTEKEELIEYAPWGDIYWGVDSNLQGQNKLGKILMKVRNEVSTH